MIYLLIFCTIGSALNIGEYVRHLSGELAAEWNDRAIEVSEDMQKKSIGLVHEIVLYNMAHNIC